MPVRIGGWCMATIVGVSVSRASSASSHTTSSSPSSRPGIVVSQAISLRSPIRTA